MLTRPWFSFSWLIIMTIWYVTFSLLCNLYKCFNYSYDCVRILCWIKTLLTYILIYIYLLNITDIQRKSQSVSVVERQNFTDDDDDGWRENDECWRVDSPRGHADVSGTVWTDVAGVTLTYIAVFQVTAHSVSTQRHSELDTLVDILTEVVGRCAVSYKPPTGRTPGQW